MAKSKDTAVNSTAKEVTQEVKVEETTVSKSETERNENKVAEAEVVEPVIEQPTDHIFVTAYPIFSAIGSDYPMVRGELPIEVDLNQKQEVRYGAKNGTIDSEGIQTFTKNQIDRWVQGGIVKKAKRITRQETVYVDDIVEV